MYDFNSLKPYRLAICSFEAAAVQFGEGALLHPYRWCAGYPEGRAHVRQTRPCIVWHPKTHCGRGTEQQTYQASEKQTDRHEFGARHA